MKNNRIVTIRAENLRPGDILVSKIAGKTYERKVLSVFPQEWPDRVNVGFTLEGRNGLGETNGDFRPFNLIQVRRAGDSSFKLNIPS
jgi:hypothetical protein